MDERPAAGEPKPRSEGQRLAVENLSPAVEGQRPASKPAQGIALGTPNKDDPSPERASPVGNALSGLDSSRDGTQGGALGWLVGGPLALRRRNNSSASHVPSGAPPSRERKASIMGARASITGTRASFAGVCVYFTGASSFCMSHSSMAL